MTDKQIIDGERIFKCVWCKYDFRESDANFILSENPNECVCSGCMTEWADNLLWDFKRKEQECKKLKEKLLRKRAVIEFADCPSYSYGDNTIEPTCNKNFCYDVKSCEHKNMVKFKQTLTEIKEIAEPFCHACQEHEPEKRGRDCMYCNYGKILQKISECEVENGKYEI